MDNDREIDRLKGDLSAARVSRRAFLARATALGLSASATGVLLDACGGSLKAATSAPTSGLPTTSGVGTPVRGGTLTVGAVSGGSAETLNPVLVVSDIDVLRSLQLFDTLFVPSGDLQELIPRLALSAEPNRDASVWTVKLRDGVTWHDGRPFTADDVLYTLRLWASPKSNLSGLAGNIDTQRLRKRGDLVAEVPLRTPDAQWPTTVTLNPVVQNGTAFNSYNTRPIGTGPFKFQSFTPGKQSVFVANHDYWEHGKPYLDRLVFNSSFTDENARLNALLGGSIDVLFSSPFRAAQTQRQRGAVTVFGSPSPRAFLFVTRVDKGPFADPRVREAMRLLVDRQALINDAIAGFGTPGNDLLGQGTKYFASDLKPSHDVEKARHLFKAAGKAGHTFVLQTASVIDGLPQAATLLAQQAQAAGVTIRVQQENPSIYYTPPGGLFSFPFRSNYYVPLASLDAYYYEYMVGSAPLQETGWGKHGGYQAQIDKLTNEARGELDPKRAQQLWHEVQQAQFTSGGLLVWANTAFVHLSAKHVKGLSETPAGYLNNGRFYDAWMAKQ